MGILATVTTFLSYQVNSKKKILLILTAATLFNCIGYLFLGAFSGFALNIVCIIRNIVFYFQNSSSAINRVSAVLLALLMGGLGALSWQGPVSLLIIVGLMINTLVMSLENPQLLRKSILLPSSVILLYNIFVFSLGGIFNEIVAIVSAIIGIIRFRKKKTEV